MGALRPFEYAVATAELTPTREPVRFGDGIDAGAIDQIDDDYRTVASWPGAIRARYEKTVADRLYAEQHWLFIIGLLTCLATLAIDWLINPAMVVEGAILRVLTIGPITIAGMLAADRGWTRLLGICVGAGPLAFVAVIIHLTFHLPPSYAATYLTATTLVIGLANIVMPFSLRGVVIFDLAFIATALGVLAMGPDGALWAKAEYLLLLGVVAAATLPIAFRLERLRQRNFLLTSQGDLTARELRIANERLRDQSERDPLTNALNRRGFERLFAQMAMPAEDTPADARAALMMIDVDFFKRFNDTHGHQAGDTCLLIVANTLSDILAPVGGVAARYGGEEFIAAMREEYRGHATEMAEQIRETIAALLVPVGEDTGVEGRSLITASIGVGVDRIVQDPAQADNVDALREGLIEMADAALYSAKNAGRNRVELIESYRAKARRSA